MLIKLYRILFTVLSPFLRIYFYARCLYGKDKAESVKNHFGEATIARPEGKLLWVHAASIGESTSALTFINHIKKQFPDLNILITTITVTSADILQPKIAKIPNCFHQFVVADNPSWIRKFLDHWNINAAVFLESEIWPNIICELNERSVPFFLLNARLSPRSFKRWSYFKNSFSEILRKFKYIMAQSEIDYQRYSSFSPENTKRIDNLKYANAVLPCNDDLLKIFQKICDKKVVFVAASTHEKEEDIILEAHNKLKTKFNIVTVIIPRHLTRVKRVCEIIEQHNCKYALRSTIKNDDHHSIDTPYNNSANHQNNNDPYNDLCDVYCIDSFGEVGTFYRLGDVCFVGGSLVTVGGHNIYEPVALGKPVLHGPHMENALEVRDFLDEKGVAFEVQNSDDICDIFEKLISENNCLGDIRKQALSITKNDSLKQIDEIMQLEKILK